MNLRDGDERGDPVLCRSDRSFLLGAGTSGSSPWPWSEVFWELPESTDPILLLPFNVWRDDVDFLPGGISEFARVEEASDMDEFELDEREG